ncbi:MAG: fumarylacetoacetate hydrolase family protein [Firmicutes bacterium]|nr:fumarylacetoacetate hydrolase family protein [Bacillota bacterium]
MGWPCRVLPHRHAPVCYNGVRRENPALRGPGRCGACRGESGPCCLGRRVYVRIVRYQQGERTGWGLVQLGSPAPAAWNTWQTEGMIDVCSGDPWVGLRPTGETVPVGQVRLLAPCQPSKIVAVGLNYADHAREMGDDLPAVPMLFLKPSTAVIGPEEPILYPAMSSQVDYEAELAVVIKDRIRCVEPAAVRSHILGYTCLNDVTARDLQRADGQWTRAKSFDTFAPIGPCITDEVDPDHADVALYLNGRLRQQSNTHHFIFNVDKLVSFISQVMTLLPGDVVTTGTPSGVGPMQPGDVVEVVVEGVGRLRNRVERAG